MEQATQGPLGYSTDFPSSSPPLTSTLVHAGPEVDWTSAVQKADFHCRLLEDAGILTAICEIPVRQLPLLPVYPDVGPLRLVA